MRAALFALALGLFANAASGEVILPKPLSDHAVLQRDRPIHLWGWATPDTYLTAHFRTQSVSARVDRLGEWSLYLAPEAAGGPYTLSIEGDGPAKVLKDLLVGDVWFASGQSNMEIPLNGFPGQAVIQDAKKEIAAATNPRLRLLLVEKKSSDYPLSDITGSWTVCTPETAARFSAIAYFFGREIASREKVPIGLIDSTWGGTPADSWISMDTLGTRPDLLPAFASRARFADQQADLAATLAAERREDDAARAAGTALPQHPWHPFEASWLPAGLYNGMIAPFTPLAIKGFLWYQGETNSAPDRAPFYASLFAGLIQDWRSHFQQGNLPFLYVQISSFESPGEDWGMVRDQQRRVLRVANTGMAVSLDVGKADNVHPPDKQTVAARLVLAARRLVYDEDIAYQGPLFREVSTQLQSDGRTALRVWFDHANGLNSGNGPAGGFEVAGSDGHFVAADARIEHADPNIGTGDTVFVTSQSVPNPVYVRYGWSSVVSNFLYNADGLPASTFSSQSSPED